MKQIFKIITLALVCVMALSVNVAGQNNKTIAPAIINIVDGSVHFVDADGNGVLNAGESGRIVFKVRNDGSGDGVGCRLVVSIEGSAAGVTAHGKTLPTISAGQLTELEIPINTTINAENGKPKITFKVDEPNGFGSKEATCEFSVQKRLVDFPVEPKLKVVAVNLSQSIERRTPFTLEFTVKNIGEETAKGVTVDLSIPDNVFFTAGGSKQTIGSLAPGESVVLKYNMIVNNDYIGNDISTWLDIKENYGVDNNFVSVTLAVNGNTTPKVENDSPRFVDLGLPGGVLWATCNVGASKPEEYGLYFAWGKTKGYTKDEIYKHYIDIITIEYGDPLKADYDAATNNWGNGWRMPSLQEMADLIDSRYTTSECVKLNGVDGYKITSRSNGNSIFLPAAGYRYDGEKIWDDGHQGHYWSRDRESGISAYLLTVPKGLGNYFNSWGRYRGLSVRAVRVPSK